MGKKEDNKRYYENNKEEIERKQKIYYEDNRKKIIERNKKYRENNKEERKLYDKEYNNNHKKERREYQIKYIIKQKFLVLSKYSTYNIPKCECCLEDNLEFLTIDHINGNGNKHRKENKAGFGTTFYRWLIKNNFPKGFRVLCMNCNMTIGNFGFCPHNSKEKHEEYMNLLKS